jgi:hypothetical protein
MARVQMTSGYKDEILTSARLESDPSQLARATALSDWVGVGKSKPKSKPSPVTCFKRAKHELEQFLLEGPLDDRMKGRHFVALYARLHEKTYGVAPAELEGTVFFGAVSAADRMLRVEFDGKAEAMIDFIRWVWVRERSREKGRRAREEATAFRIQWRLQFVRRELLVDFRVMTRAR